MIHLRVRSGICDDIIDKISAKVWVTPKHLKVRQKIVWIGSFYCALIWAIRSSPLSLRQQKADMMKNDFSLLLGSSISESPYKTKKRVRRWIWLVLATAVLALTAVGVVGS